MSGVMTTRRRMKVGRFGLGLKVLFYLQRVLMVLDGRPTMHTPQDDGEEEYEEEEYEEEEEEEMEEYSRGRGSQQQQQQKRRGAANDWHYADRRRRMRARNSNAMGIAGLVKGAAKVRGVFTEGEVCFVGMRHPQWPPHEIIDTHDS